jgi:serine/threonine-protein kinase HipA
VLYLWWLGVPAQPRLVGELLRVPSKNGVSLRYAPDWLQHGFALSEDLPLITGEMLPRERDTAVGGVDDARPDRWGERVILVLDKPKRRAVLDMLWLCGEERFGALGVSVSAQHYAPRALGPLPVLADVSAMEALVQKIISGQTVTEPERRLIAPGVSLGGARPKALLWAQDAQWVVKFSEPGEAFNMPLVEHASMTLARLAGIRSAETFAIPLEGGHKVRHAVAIRRFDRAGPLRLHALSAGVALKAAAQELGYPELAQLLRRRGPRDASERRAHMQEVFRRAVFNVLMDNTDDHERNHALLASDGGELHLSPAYDVLPTGQALGYQQMRLGREGHEASLDNALSEHAQYGLSLAQAKTVAEEVAQAVAGWKTHFRAQGVAQDDIDFLGQQIDRPVLLAQRQAVLVKS